MVPFAFGWSLQRVKMIPVMLGWKFDPPLKKENEAGETIASPNLYEFRT